MYTTNKLYFQSSRRKAEPFGLTFVFFKVEAD
jgi:hypothetical protein